MATKRIVLDPIVRIVYTSPRGRVTVERHGPGDNLALLDDQPIRFFAYSHEAEAAGHTALTDALAREVVEVADEAAEVALVVEAEAAEVTPQAEAPISLQLTSTCSYRPRRSTALRIWPSGSRVQLPAICDRSSPPKSTSTSGRPGRCGRPPTTSELLDTSARM